MTNKYTYNSVTKLIESEPYDPKQSLTPTIENIKLIKEDNAKFFVNGTDVSNVISKKVEKIFQDPARHKEELTWQSLRLLAFNVQGAAKPYAPDITKKAFDLMKDGISLENISAELHIPFKTLQNWSYKLKNTTKVSTMGRFTEEQREDMRKFIIKNKPKMTNPEMAKALGISLSYIWCLQQPEKLKKIQEKKKQQYHEKKNEYKPKKVVSSFEETLKQEPAKTQLVVPYVPHKPCKECALWEGKYRNAMLELTKHLGISKEREESLVSHYEMRFKELSSKQNTGSTEDKRVIEDLKEEVRFFKSIIDRVIK